MYLVCVCGHQNKFKHCTLYMAKKFMEKLSSIPVTWHNSSSVTHSPMVSNFLLWTIINLNKKIDNSITMLVCFWLYIEFCIVFLYYHLLQVLSVLRGSLQSRLKLIGWLSLSIFYRTSNTDWVESPLGQYSVSIFLI